jgi:tripeptidyl-peptidase-1
MPNRTLTSSVGATDLINGRNGSISASSDKVQEMAVSDPDPTEPKNDFYSGGGFSNVFALPSYQSKAVTNYLTKYPPAYSSAIYNNSGHARAYPDISALGLKLATVYLGNIYGVGGTSASTPLIGGIVTLLNEARIAAGKGPVGFLNPTIYAHPEAFNDITLGGNPGCGTKGFKAEVGWDPVTGMGTPIYPKLLEIFMGLP